MVNKKPYIIAGIFSFLIFFLGFSLGFSILNLQLESLRTEMDRNELDIRNLQLELIFLNTLDNETFCSYLNDRIYQIEKNIGELGKKVVNPEKFNEEYFDIIRRRYSVSLIQDWLLSKELINRCNVTRINVLYFFKINCDPCIYQGYALDYLVEKNKEENIKVYALDKDLDEPIIQLLVKKYNITRAPTLVINDKKYEGFQNKEKLKEIFCGINKNLNIC